MPSPAGLEARVEKLEQVFRLGGIGAPGGEDFLDLLGRLANQVSALTADEAIGNVLKGPLRVGTTNIEAGAVVTSKIAAGAITAGKIVAGAITTGKIAADAVTADKIAAGAVTVGDLAAGTLSVVATLGTGGSVRSAASGQRIEIDKDEIAGYDSSNVMQFRIRSSDGKAEFGGGDAVLDENGIHFGYGVLSDGVYFDAGTHIAKLDGYSSGIFSVVRMIAMGSTQTNYGTISCLGNNTNPDASMEVYVAGVLKSRWQLLPDYASMSLSGSEYFRIDEGETCIWLRIQGAMKQVTLGVDDSGGTGYRLLRVPNSV